MKQSSVCYLCTERLPERACEKDCERRQQELKEWAAQKARERVEVAGRYYSMNAERAIHKRQRGH